MDLDALKQSNDLLDLGVKGARILLRGLTICYFSKFLSLSQYFATFFIYIKMLTLKKPIESY
jgi:hypothetical protein